MDGIVSFGAWLRHRRKALHLTQNDLAHRAGVALGTLRKWESDERRPSPELCRRLADLLEIPTAERAQFVKAARGELAVHRLRPPLEMAEFDRGPLAAQPIPALPERAHPIRGYELREHIGGGAFSDVYRAYQALVGRDVAMKILLPRYTNLPAFVRRFEVEAQLVARLEHPHIVPLYDYWRDPSGAYLVMRYVQGGNLHTALHAGPLSFAATLTVLEQITSALALAHGRGVVHRGLKPANLLLDEEGNAYLADFGVATALETIPAEQLRALDQHTLSAYAAPEQIRAEPATPQTDIYSLGILLYEMLAGVHPFQAATPDDLRIKHLQEPLPALHERRSDLPATLDTIIHTATAKDPAERYPNAVSLLQEIRRVAAMRNGSALTAPFDLMIALAPTRGDTEQADVRRDVEAAERTGAVALQNPYKGLRAFQEADALDFFGREALTQHLLARLAEQTEFARFLAVVGPSGSGKSSVVRAGLLPALRRGGLPNAEQWFITDLLPGAYPFEELEAALLRVAINPPPSLLAQLQQDERGLARAVKRVLPADAATELVLVIDQFEELFTLVQEEAARRHVLDSLLAAVSDPRSRVRVIVTLRADFYDRPLLYPAFGELVRQRTVAVVALTPAEVRRAIAGSAERVGLRFESELEAEIVRDVGAQPGALPLLQYALTELFERRAGRTLTLAAYRASGGVVGALARRADELYTGLDAAAQEAARQLFLRLVMLGEGVEDTRRRVRRTELASTVGDRRAMDVVIDAYGKHRLLTFDVDPLTREPTVEVAHEALIRTWQRMRAWVDEDRDALRLRRRLGAAAADWGAAGHDPSFLATGARLAQFAELAETGKLELNMDEAAYLQAGLVEWERRQAAARTAARRLRLLAGILAAFLLLAVGSAVFAFHSRSQAVASFNQAESQRLAAEANGVLQREESPELAALLALRGLQAQYSPQADTALQRAARFDYGRQLFTASNYLFRVAFSPDGKFGLVGSNDGAARLWEVSTGKEAHVFSGHQASVTDVAFSADGHTVLTGSSDRTLLWDAGSGRELHRFPGAHLVAFSPNGTLLLTCCSENQAWVWDAQTGQQLRRLRDVPAIALLSAAFSPDGRHVLFGRDDGTAQLWDTRTDTPVRTFTGHTGGVRRVAFSPDGTYVVTGGQDMTARLWQRETGQEVRRFVGHAEQLFDIAVSPDGRHLLTGSLDTTARVWDVQTGRELRRFVGHTSTVYGVAFSPDGRYALTSGSTDKTVRLWDIQAPRERGIFTAEPGWLFATVFSPDGKAVLTAGSDRTTRLWDAGTGQEVRRFDDPAAAGAAAVFSPDHTHVLTGGFDGLTRMWDLATGKPVRSFAGTGQVMSIVFSADGRYLLTSYETTTELWDPQTGAHLRTFRQGGRAALSPDGRYVVITTQVGSGNDDVTVWETQTGRQVQRLPHGDGATAAAFSHDGTFLVTVARRDWNLRLWNTKRWEEVRVFTGHTTRVGDVTFSPDDQYLLSSSQDKTVRLWDVASGKQVRTFPSHAGAATSASFSYDGRQVIVGSSDGVAQVTETNVQRLIADVCRRVLRDFTADERAVYTIQGSEPTCPDDGPSVTR